jgi:hypothetical protein
MHWRRGERHVVSQQRQYPTARELASMLASCMRKYNEVMKLNRRPEVFTITSRTMEFLAGVGLCRDERSFGTFVVSLHQAVVESSGNGQRLPDDYSLTDLVQTISKLRHFFSHDFGAREGTRVRKKFSEIGDILKQLNEGRTPTTSGDWARAQKTLLLRIVREMERVEPQLSQPEPLEIEREFLKAGVELFSGEKLPYWESVQRGAYANTANCIVFLPEFYGSRIPQIGTGPDVVHVPWGGSRSFKDTEFVKVVSDLTKIWRLLHRDKLLEIVELPYWGVSQDSQLLSGVGADSLSKALKRTNRAMVSVIFQGCFGQDYSKTCFLVLSGYWKWGDFLQVELDLYLSVLPVDWGWAEELFSPISRLTGQSKDLRFYTIDPLPVAVWLPVGDSIVRPNIVGGIARRGWSADASERKHDTYGGVIVDTEVLRGLSYRRNLSRWRHIMEGHCPIKYLSQAIIAVIYAPPMDEEWRAGKIADLSLNSITMMGFHHSGFTTYALSIRASPAMYTDVS